MWNNSEVSEFVRGVAKISGIEEDRVMSYFISEYNERMRGRKNTKENRYHCVKGTLRSCKEWFSSKRERLTIKLFVGYRPAWVFFNVIKNK